MLNWTLNEPSTVPPADSGQALKVIVRPAPEMPQTFEPPGRLTVTCPGQTSPPRTVVIPEMPEPLPPAPPAPAAPLAPAAPCVPAAPLVPAAPCVPAAPLV